jgi:hypothetical protein
MQLPLQLRFALSIIAVCLSVQGQPPQTDKGMPPRSTPGDYQAHAQAGAVTLGAEFLGHAIPTPQGPLSTEDYVVVETGLFGASGAPFKLSADDFSLRINSKKPLPSQPYGLVIQNVKDPEWQPPTPVPSKSKGGVSAGRDPNEPPPLPPKVPIEIQRAMAQRVQKASLPAGDRVLPQAGLLFFEYHGKTQSIKSIELIYAGPAGKATLTLQP